MAKLSELIPAAANTLGMPETAIEAYAKALRKAGLITTGGRGFGAADMTARDCAHLLTAIMAGSPTYAVERVETYGKLTCSSELGEASSTILEAFNLLPGHSFLDLLCQIIEFAKDGRIDDACVSALRKANIISMENPEFLFASIEVEFPEPTASIEVSAFLNNKKFSDKIWVYYLGNEFWNRKNISVDDEVIYGDLKHKSAISKKTINSLGEIIRS